MAIVDKVIKPTSCFFGMCLPVTKEDFFRSLEADCDKTYTKIRQGYLRYNAEALWEIDHLPLVNLFNKKMTELKKLGVHLCLNFSLRDLSKIQDFEVATIFAHHDDNLKKVELFDGMYGVDTFIECMPNQYDKILDLTMCRSISLQTGVTKYFKNSIVVANKLETNPEFRLLCYFKTITLLQNENISYIDAIAKTRILLLDSMKKKMKSLKDVIISYSSTSKKLGGTAILLDNKDKDNLREDLNKLSEKNGRIFWIVLFTVLTLFIVALIFVGFNQDKPEKIRLVFGITGVSIMGLIYYMTKIWKEKNYIDMTLILVRTLDKDMINSILTALLAKL